MLWAQRLRGGYDEAAAIAFLRGYRDGGGIVDRDDPAALGAAPAALVGWVLDNIEMAIARPTDAQDELAAALIQALLWMPAVAAARQIAFARFLAEL